MAENAYSIYLKGNVRNGQCDDINCKFIKVIKNAALAANIKDSFNVTDKNTKEDFEFVNDSRRIKIDRKTVGSIRLKEPTSFRIHFTPQGLIIDGKVDSKNTKRYTKHKGRPSKKHGFINNTIEMNVENVALMNCTVANPNTLQDALINNYRLTIISPKIDKKHTKKKANRMQCYSENIQNLISGETSTDSKTHEKSLKEKSIEQLTYHIGCFRVIIQLRPELDTMLIRFIDERLGLRESQGNPGVIANYFDDLAMDPVSKIADVKDVIDHINLPTLNEDIDNVRQILLALPNKESLNAALNTMHPSKAGDIGLILCNNHSLLYSNICRHFNELECSFKTENKLDIWGKVFNNFQHFRTRDSITGYSDRTSGILIGADYYPTELLCLGSGFAFSRDDVKWHNVEADALLNTYYGLLYSLFNYEMFFLEAMGSVSYTCVDANRYIRASAVLQRKANYESEAITYSGRLRGGYNFNLPYEIGLQVFDSIDLGNANHKKFMEHGAGALNLRVNKHDSIYLRNEVGIQLSKNYFSKDQSTCWTPSIALKWVYQNPLSGTNVTANFQHQPSQFTIKTRNHITNQIAPEISLTTHSYDGMYISTYYEGAFGDGWKSNELGLHVGKNF